MKNRCEDIEIYVGSKSQSPLFVGRDSSGIDCKITYNLKGRYFEHLKEGSIVDWVCKSSITIPCDHINIKAPNGEDPGLWYVTTEYLERIKQKQIVLSTLQALVTFPSLSRIIRL